MGGAGRHRIGFFTNNYLPMLGGVTSAVETLRMHLGRLGHRVVIVAPRMRGAAAGDPDVIRVPGVPAPTYPDFSLPLPISAATRRAIRALDLDVFHAHHPFLLGGTARRLAREAGRPLVFTHHTLYDKYAHYVPLPRPWVARAAIRWSTAFANDADLVLAPSEALATRLRAQGVRRPVEVLPTGVDAARFHPGTPGERASLRRALGLPARSPLLLYSGRLDREKNLPFLLKAFQRLAAARPEATLVLVGRGTQESPLRALAGSLATAGRVRFAGGVAPDEVPRYYRAADLFLFASTTETQGLAVLEAMATGLPVVAVRAAGVEEAVVDGVGGLLVPEDVAAFAAAVTQLLDDPALAAKLAAGARETACRLAAQELAARLVGLYHHLRRGSA